MTVPLDVGLPEDDDLSSDLEAQPVQFLFPPLRPQAALAQLERHQPTRLSALADRLWTEPPTESDANAPATVRRPPPPPAPRLCATSSATRQPLS